MTYRTNYKYQRPTNAQPLTTLIDYLLLFLFAISSTEPLWVKHLFYSHENFLLPMRVLEVHRALMDGVICARWFPDYALGFGLPQLVFFPPLSLYIAAFFQLLGCNLFLAIKGAFLVGILGGAFGMYLLARAVWGRYAAMIAATAYIFAPYRLVNLYVRGDLHEFLALSCLPFILFCVYRFEYDDRLRYFLGGIISYSALIICHNLVAVLFSPFLVLFIFLLFRSTERKSIFLVRSVAMVLTTFLLTLFFWGPALYEKRFVKIGVLAKGFGEFKNHFIELKQFFSNYWGFGGSVKGPNDTMSFQIGNVAIILSILFILFELRNLWFEKQARAVGFFAVLTLIISVFMMTKYSEFVWQSIPFMRFFQFPYRFLSLASLASCLMAGAAIRIFPERVPLLRPGATLVVLAFIMGVGLTHCRVADYLDAKPEDITPQLVRQARATIATGEYVPVWVPEFPPPKKADFALQRIPESGFSREENEQRARQMIRNNKVLELYTDAAVPLNGQMIAPRSVSFVQGRGSIQEATFKSNSVVIKAYAMDNAKLRVGVFYFPGWRCEANGEGTKVEPDPQTGLISFAIKEGSQFIILKFGPSLMRLICELSSCATFLAVVVWSVFTFRKRRQFRIK